MIKIKKIKEDKSAQKVTPAVKKLFENFFTAQITKKDKVEQVEKSRFQQYVGFMKQLFGGKTEDYRELIEEHKLNLYGLVGMHCYFKGISQEEGEKMYVDFVCKRFASVFNKEED